ncbi:MAG: TetR/AcrR family transcriptional regulator [Pseudomonadota bacterium]
MSKPRQHDSEPVDAQVPVVVPESRGLPDSGPESVPEAVTERTASATARASALDRIRGALRGVFLRQGYAGASIASLAAASELGKASLYHHFPGGKIDMGRAVVREAVAKLQQAVSGPSKQRKKGKADASDRLLGLVDAFSSYVGHGREPCLLATFALENASAVDREQLARQFEHWRAQVAFEFEALGFSTKASRKRAERLFADLYGYLCLGTLCNEPEVFVRGTKQLRREIKKLCG